jgi:hypothetical protein
MDMLYLFLLIVGLTLIVLLSSMRVRFAYNADQLCLFVGLGKVGAELDFRRGRGVIKAFGRSFKQFPLKSDKPSKTEPKPKKKPDSKAKLKRTRPLPDLIAVARKSRRAIWLFVINILRAVAVEEADGELTAGFDSPDYTGMAYGYYFALAGAVPAVGKNLTFNPDWNGASVKGAIRLSFALPVYKLTYRLAILLIGLPLRDLIKLAIGTKKGGHDGQ